MTTTQPTPKRPVYRSNDRDLRQQLAHNPDHRGGFVPILIGVHSGGEPLEMLYYIPPTNEGIVDECIYLASGVLVQNISTSSPPSQRYIKIADQRGAS